MSKQTALQWLKDVLYPYLNKEDKEYTDVLFNKALEMEREQIENAFRYGVDVDLFNGNILYQTAQQYYNEIYGGQDE
jgi:hypothetical protein